LRGITRPERRKTNTQAPDEKLQAVGRALSELIGNSTAAAAILVTVLAEELIEAGLIDRQKFLARLRQELVNTNVYGQSQVRAALKRLSRDLSTTPPRN
jgi:dTDP-4-amino-4,6-dideoxygalactose transaminase